jgi:hypothetical protein
VVNSNQLFGYRAVMRLVMEYRIRYFRASCPLTSSMIVATNFCFGGIKGYWRSVLVKY